MKIKQEIITKAIERTIDLTNFFKPKNEWEEKVVYIFRMNILINNLLREGLITKKEEKEIRVRIIPISNEIILNSPHLRGNEKLKKSVRVDLLNENAKLCGLGNFVRFFDC